MVKIQTLKLLKNVKTIKQNTSIWILNTEGGCVDWVNHSQCRNQLQGIL